MLSTACSLCAQWHPEAQIDVNNIKTNLYGTGNFSIMRGGHNFEGFGFVEIEGQEEDFFIPAKNVNGALNGDTVRIYEIEFEFYN